MKILLLTFTLLAFFATAGEKTVNIICNGSYRHHLQGIATDGKSIYWSMTTTLIKTDLDGNVLVSIEVPMHHGGLCVLDGKVYVALGMAGFNKVTPPDKNHVYVYDASDLKLLEKHPVPEACYGAGAVAAANGFFYVVGGLPKDHTSNHIFQYDKDFKFVRQIDLEGYTLLGIQSITYWNGHFFLGAYSQPRTTICDSSFNKVSTSDVSTCYGLAIFPDGRFLVGKNVANKDPETKKALSHSARGVWIEPLYSK